MIRAGVNVKALSTFMAHANITITLFAGLGHRVEQHHRDRLCRGLSDW
jgi:hypothetical protein